MNIAIVTWFHYIKTDGKTRQIQISSKKHRAIDAEQFRNKAAELLFGTIIY